MTNRFQVLFSIFADYSGFDTDTKITLAGVYGGEIVFNESPNIWPSFRFVTAIRPIAKEFRFAVRFVRPDGKNVIGIDGFYVLSDRKPDPYEVMNFNTQLPTLNFSGAGAYKIVVEDTTDEAIKVVFERPISIRIGQSPTRSEPKVELKGILPSEAGG
jgi:hypothetical protein